MPSTFPHLVAHLSGLPLPATLWNDQNFKFRFITQVSSFAIDLGRESAGPFLSQAYNGISLIEIVHKTLIYTHRREGEDTSAASDNLSTRLHTRILYETVQTQTSRRRCNLEFTSVSVDTGHTPQSSSPTVFSKKKSR